MCVGGADHVIQYSKSYRFALEVAQKTLPFYKEYFKVAYPLPKIDLIAIADFAAGMFCGCV